MTIGIETEDVMNLIGGVGYSASGKSNVAMTIMAQNKGKPIITFDIESNGMIFDVKIASLKPKISLGDARAEDQRRWWKRFFA